VRLCSREITLAECVRCRSKLLVTPVVGLSGGERLPVVLPGTAEAADSPDDVRMPWWVDALNQEPPDLSILDHDWADRPISDRPLLPDGARAGPYWDSLDVRLRNVRGEDEKLWLAGGMLRLEDPLTGSYSFFNETGVLEALDAGALINAPCPLDRNMTALHYAARNGSTRLVELMLDSGANVSARTAFYEWTPLHTASYSGMVDAVSLLLRAGADIHAADPQGWTAMHWAAYGGHADVCVLLSEGQGGQRIDVDQQTCDFAWSALHVAASRGFPDVCQALRRSGASLLLRDALGNDALHVARAFCMHECEEALRAMDAQDGYVEFKCVPAKIGDTECFMAVAGPSAGNCYSVQPDPDTGVRL
jgi:hypothetical protein